MCLKDIKLHVQNWLVILGSIVNLIEEEPINEHKNLDSNNEYDTVPAWPIRHLSAE